MKYNNYYNINKIFKVEIDNFNYITSNYIELNFIKNQDISNMEELI